MSLKPVCASKKMRLYLSAEGHGAITSLTYYFSSNERLVSTLSPAGVSLSKSQRREILSRYQPRFYHVWNKQLNKHCRKYLQRDTNARCASSHRWPIVFHLIIWGSEAVRWMYSIFVGCWYPGPAIPLIRPQSLRVHKATSSVTNREVINPRLDPKTESTGWVCVCEVDVA